MATVESHAELMDSVYRWQRHIYDLTRKYYLFGRDRLIDELGLPGDGRDASLLEIGCGTGRNLARIARAWPGASLHGIDISSAMLRSARARLGSGAVLEVADATCFDPQQALGRQAFDRIILSYCTSMIPPWREAIAHACAMIAPGGSLHIVDFGDMAGLPAPARAVLRAWLARFHVTVRSDLAACCMALSRSHGLSCRTMSGPFGYYQLIRLDRA